ncbi:MAG TPA: PAS domain S-box protein [Aquabacterium sp.]|uniref:PAS domain S-box protein n=1 Tax=Aquabacterium sp. TaxID=1872578 RepID=UPI002E338819|nr:PAS domain S-box protein [Aquabacterium sp.]HEX5374500.1 PAS domain S-box protein [Aquabacterium sp.]
MRQPLTAPPRPRLALPPQPRLKLLGWRLGGLPSLWAWPLMLSLVFVVGVMVWMAKSARDDAEAKRAEMISDALSLEAQIANWLDGEAVRLKALGDVMAAEGMRPESFARHALVLDGVRRFWVNVTWLDASGRIVAQVPDDQVPPNDPLRTSGTDRGLAGHLMVTLRNGGTLVARYSSANLLRQRVPWWLASKYDIRLVDVSDDVIAATVDGERREDQLWYRKAMGPSLPQAWLELSSRERLTPWWQTLPMALMAGFVLLVGAASWMLRRQMLGVARAEEAWRTEAAWRSAMEDSLSVGIRARDLDGRLVYVNRTMADMVGYTTEELEGAMPPMPYWPRGELDQAMERHLRNMAGRAPSEGYESRWQHRDGHLVDVMVFEAPLVDAQGRQIGWMASILNITERKRLEDWERRQAETMAHHSRLTMLGEVASTLAHELNQPLSAITSYNAGVLNALRRTGATDTTVLTALERMGEQAAHAGRIVRRIRDFLTRREPQREACDINQVVESATGLLKREIARHAITVTMRLDKTLPRVMADPILIEQVAANLVRNACDAVASQEGERRIEVHTALGAGGHFVKVSVTDNGPGLGGRSIETLCAPFYSTKSEGMGMGLAICRSIIELHYGGLDAEDVPSGGACLSFTVPCTGADDHLDHPEEEDVP